MLDRTGHLPPTGHIIAPQKVLRNALRNMGPDKCELHLFHETSCEKWTKRTVCMTNTIRIEENDKVQSPFCHVILDNDSARHNIQKRKLKAENVCCVASFF